MMAVGSELSERLGGDVGGEERAGVGQYLEADDTPAKMGLQSEELES